MIDRRAMTGPGGGVLEDDSQLDTFRRWARIAPSRGAQFYASAITPDVIDDVIARFARNARFAEQAGFTGVEIHVAHDYLLSRFLSPLTSPSTDMWGAPLVNRARLLLKSVRAVRAVVSATLAAAVKLNSADLSPIACKDKTLAPLANMAAAKFQLRRLSRGKTPEPRVSPVRALVVQQHRRCM